MINLIGNGLSIEIAEDNPVYNILSKFEGESFTVRKSEEYSQIKETLPDIQEEKEKTYKTIKKEDVWKNFYNEIPYNNENENENSLTNIILKSHLSCLLGGDSGGIEFKEVSEGLYKKDDYYLVVNY